MQQILGGDNKLPLVQLGTQSWKQIVMIDAVKYPEGMLSFFFGASKLDIQGW